jgi:3-hydroxyisobutyrate dehydrogenase
VDSILIDLLGGELEKIGMIGTGAMGLALLDRLKLAGVRDVTCYDAYGPALESARTLGFTAVASAAQVAKQSTLIDIVVRTDQDMLDCALGPNGVLESAQPGALLLLHSSILPHTVKKVAAAASAKNVHVIDACMTGVPDTVRAGHLSFVVGGADEDVERAKPHLLKMSKEVFHMGPIGTGAVGKLIKNMLGGAETLIVHEAIQIGIAGGIPYPKALEMMRRIGHDSVLNRWQRTFDPSGNDPLPRSGRNVLNKDIPLVAELARLLDADTPITQQLAAAADRVVAANEKRKKQA